jgi:ATP-dependent helicase/nuclease subunit B
MLRFIIGRSGTGKTRQCLEEIAAAVRGNPQANCIYLVPEQASFYAEKGLLKYSPRGGVIQAQVLSFQRLAWRILQETGGGTAPVLDEVGKALILKHILDKNKKSFKTFAGVMKRPGFLEQLVRTLAEMKSYRVTPEMLTNCLQEEEESLNEELAEKLTEFVFIYQSFEAYIAKAYLDTDDNLQRLAANLHQASFLKNAQVWLDGFHGFTPQEFAVIRELLLNCAEVNITLCLAQEHLRVKLPETHLFFQPWETYQRLLEIAAEIQCPLAEVLVLPEPRCRRFQEKEALAFLEESFYRQLPPYQGETGALKLRTAVNCQEEVEAAAREILFLCREKGLRYQDIAVLLRDFANYENLISNIFRDYAIPFFLDMKKPVRHHPLPDLIQGVLEVVQGGWNYEPLFRCLKTDFFPVSRRETDLLENYCLAHGIKGRRWTDGRAWQLKKGQLFIEQKLLQRVNKAREKVIGILLPLQQTLQAAVTGREFSEAIFAFLESIAVAEKLAYWSKKAEEKGELEEARIHLQVWNKILELLDCVVEVLGKQEMSLQEFSQVITGGLETLELGLIPPGLDQVLVGAVDRSRSPDLKAVIILGVNEGIFPARVSESGLFSDEERILLQASQINLAPTTEKRLYAEQFLIYKALTTGSHYLTLSYALADSEGKALTPSSLIKRVRETFPGAEINLQPEQERAMEKVSFPYPTFSHLALALRQAVDSKPVHPLWWQVYNWYLSREEWSESLKKIVTGLFEQQEAVKLPPVLVKKLYGETLRGSISRLEKFRACPFSHFLSYGLKLQERAEYKVGAPDLGRFFHLGLEKFYGYLQINNLVWGKLTKEQMEEIVERIVDDLVPYLQNEVLLSTARYRYLTGKLKRILLRAVIVLGEHERRGTFRPLGMEVSFGENGKLPGLGFTLNDGTKIFLQGRIDRVDAARGEQGWYLRVIDYKSGMASLSLVEIYYGLKLQLLTYLDVVLTHTAQLLEEKVCTEGECGHSAFSSDREFSQEDIVKGVAEEEMSGNVFPGGVFYFPIKDPLIAAKGPLTEEEIEKRIFSELKMKGYLLQDTQVVKLMDEEITGHSDLLPVALTRGGEFYKNIQSVLPQEKFALLCRHVEKVLCTIGSEIMSGNITIEPYCYKGKVPCTYCPYTAVCRFDPTVPGHAYQVLKERAPEEIWQEIEQKEG